MGQAARITDDAREDVSRCGLAGVTRDTISGGPMGVDQKISREDALRMVTRNHWYLTFEENTRGMIAPGRFADMVVLPEDIMTVPPKRIEQMRVLMTMV